MAEIKRHDRVVRISPPRWVGRSGRVTSVNPRMAGWFGVKWDDRKSNCYVFITEIVLESDYIPPVDWIGAPSAWEMICG